MKIKSIELKNFRQFENLKINFSTDVNKNVTIVMGNNGSGKTTLAQAFTWCLYGITNFKIPRLLNKKLENTLEINKNINVSVIIELEHNNIQYRMEREITYSKKTNDEISDSLSKVKLTRKKEDGRTVSVTNWEKEINSILPPELSKYFFFDGERIEKMSQEIQEGKSKTFSTAVKGILGLNTISNAIYHLDPKNKNTVVGFYEKSYNKNSNIELEESLNEIKKIRKETTRVDIRLKEIEEQKISANNIIQQCTEKLKEYEEFKKIEEEKEVYNAELIKFENKKFEKIQSLLKEFNNLYYSYFTQFLIKDTIKELKNLKYEEKTIPELSSKAIKYLLEHHKCICGREIVEGTEEYKNLEKLLEYLPPKSLGTLIGIFTRESDLKISQKDDLYRHIGEKCEDIDKINEKISELRDELIALDEKLLGKDVTKTVNDLTRDRKNAEVDLERLKEEESKIQKDKIENELFITQLERKITELNLANKENRKIEIYKAYALGVHEYLSNILNEKETELRRILQEEINTIFRNIYEGGLSLDIDKNYGIKVQADNYETETSTAQSISVIFAFISGIIKLAREYQNNENKELASEPYPLVMDAPLSAFDKHRIRKVCEVLPEIAEQVIIFIKDTDGDLARENLKNKIGRMYNLEKINEFNTVVR